MNKRTYKISNTSNISIFTVKMLQNFIISPYSSISIQTTDTNLKKTIFRCFSSCAITAYLIISNTAQSSAGEVSLSTINSTYAPFTSAPNFVIQGNTSCPSPSFNFSGFASNADNSASFPDTAGGNSGFSNYGVVAGLSLPFGGGQGAFCKRFSNLVVEEKKLSNEALLISNCGNFIKAGVDIKSEAFKSAFPSYSNCQNLVFLNLPDNNTQNLTPRTVPPEKGPERFKIVP